MPTTGQDKLPVLGCTVAEVATRPCDAADTCIIPANDEVSVKDDEADLIPSRLIA
jgi:hypothetical protein